MAFNILTLTGEQIRAARALSRTEQTELARLSGLSLETIKRLERIRGPVDANARTLRAIQDAFATIGVQFDGDDTGLVGVLQRTSGQGAPRPSPRQIDREPSPGAHRLIYHSRIARRADESLRPTLAFIHAEAQTLHAGLPLTGIILAREGHLLQALEGDKEVVHQAYRAISSYPQHHDLHLLEDRATTRRQFTEFSFCCGLFADDFRQMADERAFEGDFNPSGLTPNAASGLLGVARDLQQTAPRNTRGNPGACTLAASCLDSTCGRGRSGPAHQIAPRRTKTPPRALTQRHTGNTMILTNYFCKKTRERRSKIGKISYGEWLTERARRNHHTATCRGSPIHEDPHRRRTVRPA